MNNIFQTLLYQREKQKDTVLATIVWDDGSAPPGRRTPRDSPRPYRQRGSARAA